MDLCDRLSYLFGTEEHVDTRRQLVLLRENLLNLSFSDKRQHVIYSGSVCEGVAYPPSDDDCMWLYKIFRVVKSHREAIQKHDLLMVPSEFSPGYCLLLDTNQSYPADVIHVINDTPFVSSFQWKLQHLLDDEYIHGPCQSQSVNGLEYDRANCVMCSFWPDAARNWITRNRSHGWPSPEMIQNIVMNGCHFVPIGDQTSPFSQHEWRISFSIAERKLIHSFNHVQFLTYSLTRLCLKRIVEKICPDVLCSYFIKTALLYISENTSDEFWHVSNIEACFKTCLSVIYDYVDHGYCPNYFIPEYNMIKRKLTRFNRQPLLDIIRSLNNRSVVGILHLCGELTCLDEGISLSLCESKHDIQLMNSVNFHLTIKSLYDVILRMTYIDIETYLRKYLSLKPLCSIGKLSNIFSKRGHIFICQKFVHRVWRSPQMNKSKYRLHKTIGSVLRMGYSADFTTGKLTTATYMYLIGKTEDALSHIRRLSSDYPPYIKDGTDSGDKMKPYTEIMCGRGFSIDHKMRHAHTPKYLLPRDILHAFPLALRIWISIPASYPLPIDPLTYAYFLESLCYIRSKNQTLLMKSTRCLYNRCYHTLRNAYNMEPIMCIGIIRYAEGNYQSACRWLGSVYIMKDTINAILIEDSIHAVMMYIACFLNNRFRAEN